MEEEDTINLNSSPGPVQKKTFRSYTSKPDKRPFRELTSTYANRTFQNTGFGKSKYDNDLIWDADVNDFDQQGSINEHRAQEQSGLGQVGLGTVRATTKALIEVAKLPGVIGGIIAAPFAKEGMGYDTAFNNIWIKSLDNFNKSINEEVLPVYVSKAVREGNLWDNISSTSFWATDGADGLGYIIAMMVPGAVFEYAGLGSKMIKGLSSSQKLAKITAMSGKAEQAVNALKGLGITGKNIDSVLGITGNTIFEAGAETKGVGDAIDRKTEQIILERLDGLDVRRRSGEITNEQYNELSSKVADETKAEFASQKALAMRDTFVSNIGVLLGSNAIMHKAIWGKAASKFEKVTEQGFKGVAKRVGESAKRVAGAFGSEGLWEEGSQTTIENMYVNKALRKELGQGNDFNIGDFTKEYINTLNTTEGQKTIFLGGAMAGPMMSYQGRKQDVKNRKETNEILSNIDGEITNFNTIFDNDIYEVNKDGSFVYEKDENGDDTSNRKLDGAAVMKVARALNYTEQESELFDLAVKTGNTQVVETLKQKAVFNMIMPAIHNGEGGLKALEQKLNSDSKFQELTEADKNSDSKNNTKAFVIDTLETAKYLQQQNEKFKEFSRDVIELNDERADQKTKDNFLNNLNTSYLYAKHNIRQNEKQLKNLEEKKNNLLEELNINPALSTEEVLNNGRLIGDYKSKSPLLTKVLDDINENIENTKKLKKDIADIWEGKDIDKSFKDYVDNQEEDQQKLSKEKEYNDIIDTVNNAKELKDLENVDSEDPVLKDIINRKKTILQVQEDNKNKDTKNNSGDAKNKKNVEISNQFDYISDQFEEGDDIRLGEDNNHFGLPSDKIKGKNFKVSKINKDTKNITITDEFGKSNFTISFESLVKNLEHNPEESYSTEGGLNQQNTQESENIPSTKDIVHDSVDVKVISIDPATDERYSWVSEAAEEYERLPQNKEGKIVEFEINNLKENSTISDIEKRRQEELKRYDERDSRSLENITPNNPNHPTFKVGMKKNNGDNLNVVKTNTDNWNGEGEGYTIITAVISPAEFDSNGKMIKAAKIEEGIFNSKKEAEDAVQATFNKVKSLVGKKQKEINAKYDAELIQEQKNNSSSNFKPEWNEALEMIKNKDFSNPEFLIKHLPLNVIFNNGGTASLETHNENYKEKFDRTSRNLREAIVMELINGTPIKSITTTIAGQNNGQLQIEKEVLENSLLDLYEVSGNKDKINLENLYVVDDLGNLLNGKGQKWAANRKLSRGEVYLKIHTANGTPFPLKLNVQKVNNLQAEALYELYKYRFEDITSNTKSTLLINTPEEIQNIVKSNLSKELELFKSNGKSYDDVTVKDLVDLIIWDGTTSPKSQVRFYDKKLLVMNKTYSPEEFDDAKEEFINSLTNNKRQHVRFKDKKGGIKSLTIDNPNRLYLNYILQNNILNTNAKVNTPTFKGNTSIYLVPDQIKVNGKLSEFNKQIKRNVFKVIIGNFENFKKRFSDLFKLRLKLTDNESTYIDRYNKGYDRVSTLKSDASTNALKKVESKRNTSKRGNTIDLVFRDFFTDSKFHNLDKFVEMFNNHVNYINDIFPEENQLEFGNESVVKLFSILNSYANLFKEKKWKVFSQELKVGGKIGNLGTNEGRFAGTIDMVVENEIGELFLIDLKTSTLDRTKFKYENTLGESEDTFLYSEKDKIQLNTYAYLMNQLAPNTNIQGLYILPIQISADSKTKNSKFSDASNISDFNEEIPLLEVEFEKDSYENVLGIKTEDLNIKKPEKRTGKFDVSKGNVKNESFEGVEMEAFEVGSFLDQFETKPQSKKEEVKTKENKFNIQDIISKLDEKLDETSFDTDKNMFTNNFVELNGEKYYFNAKGPKDTRFLFAKKTKSGYDFNIDLSANELQTLKQKLVAISLDQTFLKKRLDNIWNSRLNSVSLQENNKTAPKPVKKVESVKKEDMKVNDIDFDKMTDAEAMKAFMKLSNAFNSKFKTTISNINLELRNNKNIKESLKKLVLFLEENKIEREEIEIKCK